MTPAGSLCCALFVARTSTWFPDAAEAVISPNTPLRLALSAESERQQPATYCLPGMSAPASQQGARCEVPEGTAPCGPLARRVVSAEAPAPGSSLLLHAAIEDIAMQAPNPVNVLPGHYVLAVIDVLSVGTRDRPGAYLDGHSVAAAHLDRLERDL